ncbi:unnamed protein product [Protopolystoma xenopodis]|uniref:CCHC FOG-type domain-containing protein n=1 Tax=Protopolystoma xenopodis TaxID=117903 RepID=A0A3S5AQ50_9PLAT|nr:unnamed protein product [Protopolystoma xenopodis]
MAACDVGVSKCVGTSVNVSSASIAISNSRLPPITVTAPIAAGPAAVSFEMATRSGDDLTSCLGNANTGLALATSEMAVFPLNSTLPSISAVSHVPSQLASATSTSSVDSVVASIRSREYLVNSGAGLGANGSTAPDGRCGSGSSIIGEFSQAYSSTGPKRDKKCAFCGIAFSSLDTLTAHMTHYCSSRRFPTNGLALLTGASGKTALSSGQSGKGTHNQPISGVTTTSLQTLAQLAPQSPSQLHPVPPLTTAQPLVGILRQQHQQMDLEEVSSKLAGLQKQVSADQTLSAFGPNRLELGEPTCCDRTSTSSNSANG